MPYSPIIWDDSLSVGDKNIDMDHKMILELIDRVNKIDVACIATLSQYLCDLADYSNMHLTREEWLMTQYHYPRREEHIREHWEFINEIAILINAFERCHLDVFDRYKEMLNVWLYKHITTEDKQFGDFLKENYGDRCN